MKEHVGIKSVDSLADALAARHEVERCAHRNGRRQEARVGSAVPEVLGELVCLLYTSDAADEEDSGDLGGRRNIKKKKIYDKDLSLIKKREKKGDVDTDR